MVRRLHQAVSRWLSGERAGDPGENDNRRQGDPPLGLDTADGDVESIYEVDERVPQDPIIASHSELVRRARARGIDDALRHEEDLLAQALPIIGEVEAICNSRLGRLRVDYHERARALGDATGAAEAELERAQAALHSSEAALVAAGVPVNQVGLDCLVSSRRIWWQSLAIVAIGLAAAAALFVFEAGVFSVLLAAATTATVLTWYLAGINHVEDRRVAALRRLRLSAIRRVDRARERRDSLVRELDDLPGLIHGRAQLELNLPMEQVTAYESAVVSALPPGALANDRTFAPQPRPAVPMPSWVPEALDPVAGR